MDRPSDDEALFYCQKNLPFGKGLSVAKALEGSVQFLDGVNVESITNSDAIEKLQDWKWKVGNRNKKPKREYLQKGRFA